MLEEYLDDEEEGRHKNSIDTFSLLETDAEVPSAEDVAIASQMQVEILHALSSDRERFIALALEFGFDKAEIAYICDCHPSGITRETQKMREVLGTYHDKRKTRI